MCIRHIWRKRNNYSFLLFLLIDFDCNKDVISYANCSRERVDLISQPAHDVRWRDSNPDPDASDGHFSGNLTIGVAAA